MIVILSIGNRLRSSKRFKARTFAPLAAGALLLGGCGSGSSETAETAAQVTRPTVVVSTNILGDVVENLVGDTFIVETIMPVGTDPHDFQPSAQQVAQMTEADALIVNGANFEEGLVDVIESAESDGVPVFEAIDAVTTIEFGSQGHDDHGDEEHGDDEHGDDEHGDDEHSDEEHSDEEHDHDHEGVDPHFFTDPARMAVAAEGIVAFLINTVDGVDEAALQENAASYLAELEAADVSVAAKLETISPNRRVLITNHEVFGYFAERYGFEVVGTIIPSGTTADAASAESLAELVEIIEDEGVPAVFADTSSSDQLAQTLSQEVGDVAVVELFSESLGPDGSGGATYLEMIQTNADRVVAALAA